MRGWWRIIWRTGSANGCDLLLIENVGNLVCPTSYDLGEDAKIVVLSVTEGEDKPLKYPGIFRKAELMILNKIDLLPYVPFDPKLAHRECPADPSRRSKLSKHPAPPALGSTNGSPGSPARSDELRRAASQPRRRSDHARHPKLT